MLSPAPARPQATTRRGQRPPARPFAFAPSTLPPVRLPPRQCRMKVHLASSSSPADRAHHNSSGRTPKPVHTPSSSSPAVRALRLVSSAARAAGRSTSRAPPVEHRPSPTFLACLVVALERVGSRARLRRSDTTEQGRATAQRAEHDRAVRRALGPDGEANRAQQGRRRTRLIFTFTFRVLCVNFRDYYVALFFSGSCLRFVLHYH
ncbi:hypothetical protein VPH35_056659 [Triticum aestivum]